MKFTLRLAFAKGNVINLRLFAKILGSMYTMLLLTLGIDPYEKAP